MPVVTPIVLVSALVAAGCGDRVELPWNPEGPTFAEALAAARRAGRRHLQGPPWSRGSTSTGAP